MSQNKTYIHYPADRLIEGKLWPHLIQNMPEKPNADNRYGGVSVQETIDSYQRFVKLALAHSIPFDKKFVEQIRIAITESDDYNGSNKYQREPSPEKIYKIDGIETSTQQHCNADCQLKKVVIIKQAKEEPQESKPIKGYEDYYWINRNGDIGSYPRKSKNGFNDIIYKSKLLKYHLTQDGYSRVKLRDSYGIQKSYLIHRLVAINFIPNPENKLEINHINGIKDDNRVENLEWNTHTENTRHSRFVLKRGGRKKNIQRK